MAEPVRNAPDNTTETPDIRALMERIRARISRDVEANRDRSPLRPPSTTGEGAFRQGSLQHSEELAFLNRHYAFELLFSPAAITTHRRGPLGRLIVEVKRRFVRFLREAVLRDYLKGERDFHENLVRFLNEIGRYIDARDETITRAVAANIHRVADDKSAAIVSLDQRTGAGFAELIERIGSIDAMVRGLEGIVNNLPRYTAPEPPQAKESASPVTTGAPDIGYLLLENRFRGSEHEISRRLSIYPEIFRGASGPVLEIGSGRGELQRLFKEAGIESYGVDLDRAMVNVACAEGAQALHGDGIAHLRTVADRSLGGLIAVQVVEHLTREQLHELFTLTTRKLKSGARAVFETINPQSLLALSSNYFRDPTHVWPMHPDTLGYMATLAGLTVRETRHLSPVSPNYLLREIPIDSAHTPEVAASLQRINANIDQLNKLLYGFQDYCLVLEVK